MSLLRKKLFDSEQPSKSRLSVMLFIYSVMALDAYGWWADFVPSPEWSDLGFNLAIISTVIFITAYCISLALGLIQLKGTISFPFKVLSLIIVPALIFLMFWLSIVHGAGNIATETLGLEGVLTASFSKSHENNRRNCDYQLHSYAIESAMPNHICISGATYSTLPEIGEYQLKVKNSFFGFHINEHSIINR